MNNHHSTRTQSFHRTNRHFTRPIDHYTYPNPDTLIYNDHFTNGPAYILPDGRFLNLLENNLNNHFCFDHQTRARGTRTATNELHYIRINDRTPLEVLAELPVDHVTDEQWVSLERFFDTLLDKGITFCEVGIEPYGSKTLRWTENVAFYERFDFLETKPYIAIQRIKNYYNKKTE